MVRASAYVSLKDYDNALKDIYKATNLNPEYGTAYFVRSKLFEGLGNKKQAKSDLTKAKSLGFSESKPYKVLFVRDEIKAVKQDK